MSSLIRIVIDTSVWISGVFFTGTPYRVLVAWRDQKFDVVYTPEALHEIESRLHQKALDFSMDPVDALEWIEYIKSFACFVPSTGAGAGICRDPKDDQFLDAAVSGGARYIVSGDQDLLTLDKFQGVKIIKPRDFLDLIESGKL